MAGIAVLGTTLTVVLVLLVLGMGLLQLSLYNNRLTAQTEQRVQAFQLAEAGAERLKLDMWMQFRDSQDFDWHDATYTGAAASTPRGLLSANLPADDSASPAVPRRFSAAVIGYTNNDSYTRDIVIRSVGWLDRNNSGGSAPDPGETASAIVQRIRLRLSRASVFDYVYFVNNFGWMTGFTQNTLWVNGDMRANGDFNINGGTVNGQIIAAPNVYLYDDTNSKWGAPGVASVTSTVNMANATYTTSMASMPQVRDAYSLAKHGSKTADTFATWKDVIYDQTPDVTLTLLNGQIYGSVISDKSGTRELANQTNVLAQGTTQTIAMPDLRDINSYRDRSAAWTDLKTTYRDGSANPYTGQPAYADVWDTTKGAYKRVTGQSGDPKGVVSGSVALIGDTTHPVMVHGPVTVIGDIAIRGVIQGQGVLYAGRNIHIIGDVTYKDPPSFQGTNAVTMDNSNEKKTVLGLCARGSIIMGNTKNFTSSSPLQYMKKPTTRDRKDDATGQFIAAFDGTALDTGYTMQSGGTPKKYQSLFGDTWISANVASLTRIDAILYTNNCAGGLVGDGTTKGFTINGTIISKDEAMVVNQGSGAKMILNYDTRIKERSIDAQPLIDIDLPRTPNLYNMGWDEVKP